MEEGTKNLGKHSWEINEQSLGSATSSTTLVYLCIIL